jgi:hypothetical protein
MIRNDYPQLFIKSFKFGFSVGETDGVNTFLTER